MHRHDLHGSGIRFDLASEDVVVGAAPRGLTTQAIERREESCRRVSAISSAASQQRSDVAKVGEISLTRSGSEQSFRDETLAVQAGEVGLPPGNAPPTRKVLFGYCFSFESILQLGHLAVPVLSLTLRLLSLSSISLSTTYKFLNVHNVVLYQFNLDN